MEQKLIQKYLEEVQLFQGLRSDEVRRIISKGLTMRFAKEETIFRQDTTGSQMYVVLDGKVGVVEGEKCLAELGAGAMFGEMALVTKKPRSASIIALEDSRLFVLSESTFERLMTKRVAIRILLNIVRVLSDRLKIADDRISHMDKNG